MYLRKSIFSVLFLLTSDLSKPHAEEPELPEPTTDTVPETARSVDGVLDTVVVTATSLEEKNFYVPYVTDSLSGETINVQKSYRTLPEALRETPGVHVQKTGHGQGSPFIRGFTGFRTLLLIDGIRLNNAVFRDGPNQYWNTIDPLTVERLEVVKGPSSVLYGSDAIGGTVQVVSRARHPLAGDEGDLRLGSGAFYRFASAERSHTARGEVNLATGPESGRFGFLGGVSSRDFGELSGGRHTGTIPNTEYDELDGDGKALWMPNDELELVIAFQRVTQEDVPRTHSTIFSKSYRGTTIGSDLRRDLDQRRNLAYFQSHWTPKSVDWLSRVSFSTSYHLQEETELRIRSNLRKRKQGLEDHTYGTWVQLESPSPVGTLTYGVEYYHDEVDSFFREFNADGSLRTLRSRGPVADDSSYDLFGVYVQDSFQPLEKLEVILGGRFNYAHAEADNVDPDPTSGPVLGTINEDYDAAVGSVRLLYEATEALNLFGGVSQGFRAPNLSDLTRFDVARSGEVETPSPDLEPEDYVSFEVGTKWFLEDLGVQGYTSYYYMIVDGMIVRFPTGNVIDGDPEVTKDNVGDGFVHGVELSLSYSFLEDYTLFGHFSWLEGENDTIVGGVESSVVFSRMSPAVGTLGLHWDSPARKYYIETSVTIADNQDRLSPRDEADTQRIPLEGTPGYTVFTLRAGARIMDGLRAFGAIENITDNDYRVHGSGQNEAGTNLILGAEWRFK